MEMYWKLTPMGYYFLSKSVIRKEPGLVLRFLLFTMEAVGRVEVDVPY